MTSTNSSQTFNGNLLNLQADFRHPSLRARKKSGSEVYEARIDYHYRFTYHVDGEKIIIDLAGPHDEGLGKK